MNPTTRSLLAATLALSATASQAAVEFTDWTAADSALDVATGTINTIGVSLSGSSVTGVDLAGNSVNFAGPSFTPELPLSDWIEIVGLASTASYTVSFSEAVLNPVLHFASLASTLVFAGINPVLVSGDGRLQVNGNAVTGMAAGSIDANGTIQLDGSFTSFSFTATYAGASGDGIAIQVGIGGMPAPVPEPSSMALSALGLGSLGLWMRRRRA